eukprot:CAMPEP_0185742010 /NCGR_PEP_ID=MMETSP1171-20130828/39257_1 /TAXON_ID=374046 /ORGANISM="Helicotheca tamensis, Strain CCMP826" /LENGTH=377 /DNA_ID=CAMNT_0028414007 /DNA_START=25 /DNA_END=1155 /DNA_ORIENTATION=-
MSSKDSSEGDKKEEPLPPGWSKGFSRSQQKPYYFHAATKHNQWHFPTASEAADPAGAKRRMQEQHSSSSSSSSTAKRRPDAAGGDTKRQRLSTKPSSSSSSSTAQQLTLTDSTSVAIIVPYRDIHPAQNRASHLHQFLPHMHKFLTKLLHQKKILDYHIYIIEQSNDNRKFNRGKLLNIGFDLARKNNKNLKSPHDIFIFHDVDLLPHDNLGEWYAKYPKSPIHIARCWDRYSNNPKYFGGIVSFSAQDMRRINGYPNTFWGWGGEDDEMQKRCENLGVKWNSPHKGDITDLENMSLKEKLSFLRSNRSWKCMVKWEAMEEHEKTWRTNGLVDLVYEVLKMEKGIYGYKSKEEKGRATKITVDVKLNGNHWANDKCS